MYKVNKTVVDLIAALASAVLYEARLSTSTHAVPRLLMDNLYIKVDYLSGQRSVVCLRVTLGAIQG